MARIYFFHSDVFSWMLNLRLCRTASRSGYLSVSCLFWYHTRLRSRSFYSLWEYHASRADQEQKFSKTADQPLSIIIDVQIFLSKTKSYFWRLITIFSTTSEYGFCVSKRSQTFHRHAPINLTEARWSRKKFLIGILFFSASGNKSGRLGKFQNILSKKSFEIC